MRVPGQSRCPEPELTCLAAMIDCIGQLTCVADLCPGDKQSPGDAARTARPRPTSARARPKRAQMVPGAGDGPVSPDGRASGPVRSSEPEKEPVM